MNNDIKKVGLLGGSFNPLHLGHLMVANYCCQYENLNEVWLMVAPLSPGKNEESY